MVVLGAIIVIISYMLPTNEGTGKGVKTRELLAIRRILVILALILFGFISFVVAYYVFHIEIPP